MPDVEEADLSLLCFPEYWTEEDVALIEAQFERNAAEFCAGLKRIAALMKTPILDCECASVTTAAKAQR